MKRNWLELNISYEPFLSLPAVLPSPGNITFNALFVAPSLFIKKTLERTKHTVKAFTKVLIMVERRSGNSLPGCSRTKDNDDERIPWIPNDKVCE